MDEQREIPKNKIYKYAFFSACGVLLVFILWSVVFETLLPLYRQKVYDEFLYNLFGIPVIIIGTGIFAYGGFAVVRDTLRELALNEKIALNLDVIKNRNSTPEKIRAARSENTGFLLTAWKKGAFRLLIGAALIIAGGAVINLKNILL